MPNIIRWGSPRFAYTLYPKGLKPDQLYTVDGEACARSGESLMSAGLNVELEGDDDSKLIRLGAVEESV